MVKLEMSKKYCYKKIFHYFLISQIIPRRKIDIEISDFNIDPAF